MTVSPSDGGPTELPDALAGLVGVWSGEGVGASPSLSHDYRFGQELVVSRVGPMLLSHVSRSWLLPVDGAEPDRQAEAEAAAVLHEAGFWRYDPTSGAVELVIAAATGVAAVLLGQVRLDRQGSGGHVELATDWVSRTATAVPVTAEKRLYSRRGDVLLYAVDQAVTDRSLAPRASAALRPA